MTASEHLATPVPLPDLSHLTHTELGAMRAHVTSQMREARKNANKALQKHAELRKLWMVTVSLTTKSSEEDRRAAFDPFHREILKHPEAFLVYAHSNALHTLDQHVWAEMLRRTK